MIHQIEKNLGRFLFPRSERWQQQKKTRIFLCVLLVELLMTTLIALVIIFKNSQ